MKNQKVQSITQGAVIAAVYTALTLIPAMATPALASISFGIFQVRISEALTILPRYTKSAVWGLFVGCILSNLIGMAFSGLGIIDVVLGSLATLLAAYLTYRLRFNRFLALLPPVIINAVVVGTYLPLIATPFKDVPIIVSILWVGFGELLACYVLGLALSYALDKYQDKIFIKNN